MTKDVKELPAGYVELNTEIGVFKIPISVSEITFSEFLDFRAAEDKFFEVVSPESYEKTPQEADASPLLDDLSGIDDYDPKKAEDALAAIISVFVRGPVEKLPLNFPGEDPSEALRRPFAFDFLSKFRLYGHLFSLIRDKMEEVEKEGIDHTFSAEYKGEAFFIEPDDAKRVLMLKTYEAGEVVTISRNDQLLTEAIEKNGDPSRAIEFERELRAMAVLLRKKGERLPSNIRDLTQFIDDRARHFSALPMDIVLRVRFFLASTFQDLKRMAIMRFLYMERHG